MSDTVWKSPIMVQKPIKVQAVTLIPSSNIFNRVPLILQYDTWKVTILYDRYLSEIQEYAWNVIIDQSVTLIVFLSRDHHLTGLTEWLHSLYYMALCSLYIRYYGRYSCLQLFKDSCESWCSHEVCTSDVIWVSDFFCSCMSFWASLYVWYFWIY